MENRCSNCGYNYDVNDIYCARCGKKIVSKNSLEIESMIERFDMKTVAYKKQKKKKKEFSASSGGFFDNALIGALIFLLILAVSVCSLLFFLIKKHDTQKDILQFKNLTANPSQIPLLHDERTYTGLFENLSEVEKFLLLYLTYSKDSQERKIHIFSNFLTELEKIPNLLNEKISNEIPECKQAKNNKACVAILRKEAKKAGVKIYSNAGYINLYVDYGFIKNKYYKFLDIDLKEYINHKSIYNTPVSLNGVLFISPRELADKIYDMELIYKTTQNQFVRDIFAKTIFEDFKKFIFSPSIYATTTQEMKPEFEKAYLYFIENKKESVLRPLVMSYMDKKRAYSLDNFKKDYPLKYYEDKFDENIDEVSLSDVFALLRKNAFVNNNEEVLLKYVFNIKGGIWKKYNSEESLIEGDYVITEPDENNNISIYNYMFSPLQELNIYKYSKLYLINDSLYVFNKDKLSLLKITYNGKTFNLYNLSNSDVTTLFPGVELINMDSFSSYDILIEKANQKASYIIISRYSQGWNDYNLVAQKGNISNLALPNMFAVDTNDEVIFSFKTNEKKSGEISENSPAYKFTIKTQGHNDENLNKNAEYPEYDEKTKKEEDLDAVHKPNIMPKLQEKTEIIDFDEDLPLAPIQNIDPPLED